LEEQDHPFFAALRRARVYGKARSTFLEALVDGHLAADGRLHPEWHPLRAEEKGGTVSGRYSCSDPSLHQIPARDDEIGPLVRALFVPEPGERWFVFDVSQQEPRFTVHYAAVGGMSGAERAVELINANPRLDYHQMVADLTGLPRKTAKVINLARAYGAGGAKLCRQMGLPTATWTTPEGRDVEVAGDEGKRILQQYKERFPFIGALAERCQGLAQERGWIRTYAGRLCRFPLWEPKGWGFRGQPLSRAAAEARWGLGLQRSGAHKAMNRLIQGSSADMVKLAMLAVWRETGTVPLLQVHDELDCSLLDDPALVRRVDELIRTSVKLKVPLLTDIDAGPSWGEAERWTHAD
jgi:DNA polymerase I-like protein with 3'-5' exonuclease and polymerase domains